MSNIHVCETVNYPSLLFSITPRNYMQNDMFADDFLK